MKFSIPEISWHNRDPVLSVDFQPKSESSGPLRLASGGTDSHVLIWYVSVTNTGSVDLEVAADLTRHSKAVNVVRWSPSGQYLASGDDEAIIFIWKQKTEETPTAELGEEVYKESWVIHKTLRGHMEDVLDLCWSPDSTQLASGSVDNKLLVWDVGRGRYSCILTDHKGFVQGVAWDPKGQYIATTSSDRVFRTFDVATKKVSSRSSRAALPFPPDHPLAETKLRLYHDDLLQTYYRRLQFSPDGVLVAVPAGRIEPEQSKPDVKPINAVYIYTRYSLKVPACVIPSPEPPLAVRWSPRRLAPRRPRALPAQRHLLAVATRRSLTLYDTCQRRPVALLANIHYTRLTDLTWSPDGLILVASSTDGFCSLITFDAHELGELIGDETPEPMDIQTAELSEPKKPTEEQKTSKIDSFIKFKAPTEKEKSPKKQKIQPIQQKTPVKIDVLVETAMSSWSDNSSSEIIKPITKDNDIMIIDDSEDMKLVYEESQNKSQSPDSKPKVESPDEKESEAELKQESEFLKQAKVIDVKQPAVQSPAAARAPRRVSFITLSSPKTKKNKK